jgi:hypothetical protein
VLWHQWTWKDWGGNGHGLFQSITQSFTWGDWGKPWKSSLGVVCATVEIQTGHCPYTSQHHYHLLGSILDDAFLSFYVLMYSPSSANRNPPVLHKTGVTVFRKSRNDCVQEVKKCPPLSLGWGGGWIPLWNNWYMCCMISLKLRLSKPQQNKHTYKSAWVRPLFLYELPFIHIK